MASHAIGPNLGNATPREASCDEDCPMQAQIQPHPPDETLAAFGAGKLDDAAFHAIAQHLEACTACRAKLERLGPDNLTKARHPAEPFEDDTFDGEEDAVPPAP